MGLCSRIELDAIRDQTGTLFANRMGPDTAPFANRMGLYTTLCANRVRPYASTRLYLRVEARFANGMKSIANRRGLTLHDSFARRTGLHTTLLANRIGTLHDSVTTLFAKRMALYSLYYQGSGARHHEMGASDTMFILSLSSNPYIKLEKPRRRLEKRSRLFFSHKMGPTKSL